VSSVSCGVGGLTLSLRITLHSTHILILSRRLILSSSSLAVTSVSLLGSCHLWFANLYSLLISYCLFSTISKGSLVSKTFLMYMFITFIIISVILVILWLHHLLLINELALNLLNQFNYSFYHIFYLIMKI